MSTKTRRRLTRLLVVCVFLLESAVLAAAPPAAGSKTMAQTRQTYLKYCSLCHGENGRGRGQAARMLKPRPGDFANCRHMRQFSDDELFDLIRNGGSAVGRSSLMPGSTSQLTDDQIHDMVQYVRSFCRS